MDASTRPDRSSVRHDQAVAAARRVIARSGLERTRLRDIAQEAGFTTGVLTHHFPDKRSVIFATFADAYSGWLKLAQDAFSASETAVDVLRALVDRTIPSTEEEQHEYRLWIEMLAYACSDREFAITVMQADSEVWEDELARVLGRLQSAGLLSVDIDISAEATIMNRLIDGLCIRAWMNNSWDAARRHFVLHLSQLGVPATEIARLYTQLPTPPHDEWTERHDRP